MRKSIVLLALSFVSVGCDTYKELRHYSAKAEESKESIKDRYDIDSGISFTLGDQTAESFTIAFSSEQVRGMTVDELHEIATESSRFVFEDSPDVTVIQIINAGK